MKITSPKNAKLIALFLCFALMTMVIAVASAEITVNGTSYSSLSTAAKDAASAGVPVMISGTETVSGGFESNLTVTFKGADSSATLYLKAGTPNNRAAHYGNFTFENLTIEHQNDNYGGIVHLTSAKYNNCKFVGQFCSYATTAVFNGCEFNQTSSNWYNIWTYGTKNAEFKNCTFNAAGKFVLVYNEGSNPTDAAFTNCEFIGNANFTDTGKAAVETHGYGLKADEKHVVTMKNCKIDCRIPAAFRDKDLEAGVFNTCGSKTSFTQNGTTLIHNVGGDCGHDVPDPNPDPKDDPKDDAKIDSMPQTGDKSNLILWSALVILSMLGYAMINRKHVSDR